MLIKYSQKTSSGLQRNTTLIRQKCLIVPDLMGTIIANIWVSISNGILFFMFANRKQS